MRAVVALLVISTVKAFDDSGFLDWVKDELGEARDIHLKFDRPLPSYLVGTFVQAGPGRMTLGNTRVGHPFDGFGKILRLNFGSNGTVTYSNYFLPSSYFNASMAEGKFAHTLLVADTDPPGPHSPLNTLLGHADNNFVKPHKIGHADVYLSDTMCASTFANDFDRFDHNVRPLLFAGGVPGERWEDGFGEDGTKMIMTAIMAHGQADPDTGIFTGAIAAMAPPPLRMLRDEHIVFTIDPAEPKRRKILARAPLPSGRRASYMHSMLHLSGHVVLVAQPLHVSFANIIQGKPISQGTFYVGPGDTIFQVINRTDGAVREFHVPGFANFHIVNGFVDVDGTIVIDIPEIRPDPEHGLFDSFLYRTIENKTLRDSWPTSRVVRYQLHPNGLVDRSVLLPEQEDGMSYGDFDLAKINPKNMGRPYCVFWGVQNHANAYDEAPNSTKVGPFGAFAIFKRNICTGERGGFYRTNEYTSEPEFIPNPDGTSEDDGVLVFVVFDANTQSSYVQVLDAKSMLSLSRAPLPHKVPFLIHSSFFGVSASTKSAAFDPLVLL